MTPEQFAAEYQPGFPRTVHFLLSRGIPAQNAEDLAQESWTKAWSARHQWRRDSLFITWVSKIAWNTALDRQRKARTRRFESTQASGDEVVPIRSHEQAVHARIDVDRILRRIPAAKAQLLRERFLDEKDYGEIAASRSYELRSSARVNINRALARAAAAA